VFECVPVFSDMGMKGQIVDEQAVAELEASKEAIKLGFNLLADYYTTREGPAILQLLLDPLQPARVRLKAAEMLGDIGETEAIEPLRNHAVFPMRSSRKKSMRPSPRSTRGTSRANAPSVQRSSSSGPASASTAART
jgi:hypothetical protein